MPINYDSSVTGVNTPQAITGPISDRPAATDVAEGTIYISTDTQEIYTAQAGSWITISSITGTGANTLAQVLAAGNDAAQQRINLTTTQQAYIEYANPVFRLLADLITGGKNCKINIAADESSTSTLIEQAADNGTIYNTYGSIVDAQGNDCVTNILSANPSVNDGVGVAIVSSYNQGISRLLTQHYNNNTLSAGNCIITADITNSTQSIISNAFYINRDVAEAQLITRAISGNTEAKLLLSSNYNAPFNVQTTFEILVDSQAGIQPRPKQISNSPGRVTNVYFENLDRLFGTIDITYPIQTGTLATTNEVVRQIGVDLSTGNYVSNARYGVFQIATGSNTNFFGLEGLIANGSDGDFYTLCVADNPVKCRNLSGNIFGTATINSKGLFKLMKIGNDIYSSHI